MNVPPPTGPLRGRHVELVPLSLELAPALAEAAAIDRSTYLYTDVPDGVAAMEAYIEKLLGQRDEGLAVPFAQRHLETGRFVGCTRYLELRWWRGRDLPDELEIGGTWIAADMQRTAVNTDAKLVLLSHAFDRWDVVRVAICTDARNEQSRAAISRLGASFEGVLRNHRSSTFSADKGRPRDTAVFSITDADWPAVKQGLLDREAVYAARMAG